MKGLYADDVRAILLPRRCEHVEMTVQNVSYIYRYIIYVCV